LLLKKVKEVVLMSSGFNCSVRAKAQIRIYMHTHKLCMMLAVLCREYYNA